VDNVDNSLENPSFSREIRKSYPPNVQKPVDKWSFPPKNNNYYVTQRKGEYTMSFSDQEFDDVRDERESKAFRVVKNTFKGILYGASALVWILVLAVLFTTRESGIYTEMMFTDATHKVADATEDYKVHQVIIKEFMNKLSNIRLNEICLRLNEGKQRIIVSVAKLRIIIKDIGICHESLSTHLCRECDIGLLVIVQTILEEDGTWKILIEFSGTDIACPWMDYEVRIDGRIFHELILT
jgi:hypothetical protein